MKGQSKTKQVLIRELDSLRQRIAELEESKSVHQQAEKTLREVERLKRLIFEHSSDVIYTLDCDLRVTSISTSVERHLGYRTEELVGRRFNEINVLAPESLEVAFKDALQTLAGGTVPTAEYVFIRKDGSRIIGEASGSPLVEDGKIVGLISVARDITDRKRAEEALRESEEKFRVLADSTPTAVMLYQDDRWIYANRASETICGYSEKELLAMNFWDIVHPDFKPLIQKRGRKRQRGEETTNRYELKIIMKAGTEKWVDLSGASTMLRGRPAGIISVLDINDRKRAEEALRETQRRLTDIIEFLPDATLVIDRNGKVIAWNRAIESMTGVKAEAMLGRGNYEYALPFYGERRPILIDLALHPDPEKEKAYTAIQRTGDIIIGEAYTPMLAPGDVHLSATASVLRDSRGEIIAAIECFRNNTDRKNMEERLQRAEKMEALGVLAGGVAHDMNNVLGVLVGYSELLLREVTEGSRAGKYARSILQGSERAAAIIQDLLTMARRGVSISETVNLNRIIIDFLKSPEFELVKLHHPDVLFRSQLDTGPFNIKGSPVHIFKTIMNLLSNAAESISGAGEVTITTENRYVDAPIPGYENTQEGEYVVLTVSDTGSGISPADLGRIFEPFYTKKVMGRSGTGLGLAVVWGTVKDHGGYIDVRSKENKGSAFTLYFPVTREALSKGDQDLSPEEYHGRGESILIVDDVEAQRKLAATILEDLNYRVATAVSGEDAVEYLRVNKVDLVVLDMIMDPGIDGLETYRRILEIRPRQKAIIVSGFAKTDRVGAAQKLGAGEYVKKPYVIEKIGIAVRKELDRK